MSFPLISIIVPLYNHQKYVVECLNSLKNQTYPNIEILICNDGSSDSSLLLVEEWKNKNSDFTNIYIYDQENSGVCKTLNRLISLSNGEYIATCASDDFLTINSIYERYISLTESGKLAIVSDSYTIDDNGLIINDSSMTKLYRGRNKYLLNDIINECVFNWSITGPGLLVQRKLYDAVGYYDESLIAEDRDFYLRVLSKDLLTYIPKPLAYYRIHGKNSSRGGISKRLKISESIAIVNIKNANLYKGLKRTFLRSYKLDIKIINFFTNKYCCFYTLYVFRALRYFIFNFARIFM